MFQPVCQVSLYLPSCLFLSVSLYISVYHSIFVLSLVKCLSPCLVKINQPDLLYPGPFTVLYAPYFTHRT